MKNFFSLIKESALELKNTISLTVTAMLTALYVVLHTFTTIVVSAIIEIRFSGVALAMIGSLYGPVVGGVAGAVGDVLKCLIRPTGSFFPGFTLNEFLRGFIYGAFLYKKQPTLWRVMTASFINALVVDFFLTPLWLTMMGLAQSAYPAMLLARLPKVLVMFVVDTALTYGALKLTKRVRIPKKA